MLSLSEVTALKYTATLAEWAGRFSDLPGFVYLDSGTNCHGAELEIVTALPTVIYRLQDYSANLAEWMTALETDLHSACAQSAILGSSECFTGCVAVLIKLSTNSLENLIIVVSLVALIEYGY